MNRNIFERSTPRNDVAGTAALLPPDYPPFDGSQPCAQVDNADLFFPTLGNEAAAAEATRKICRSCNFQQPCAEWALRNDEAGIWAGLTERDRNQLRRRRPLRRAS